MPTLVHSRLAVREMCDRAGGPPRFKLIPIMRAGGLDRERASTCRRPQAMLRVGAVSPHTS